MVLDLEMRSIPMRLYPQEAHKEDIVGSDDFLTKMVQEFGFRMARGTALTLPETNGLYSAEPLFRKWIQGHKNVVEIGTFRGVSAAVMAHYAEHVATIDILSCMEAMYLWRWCGVEDKIKYYVIDDNDAKRKLVESLDFDFAFIDGDHSYEGVTVDFELVKKCGNVLFHDYEYSQAAGVTQFIDELPSSEIVIERPFALWTSPR